MTNVVVSRETGVVYGPRGYRVKILSDKPFKSITQRFSSGAIGGCYCASIYIDDVLKAESIPSLLEHLPQEIVFRFAVPVEHNQQEFEVRYFRLQEDGSLVATDIEVVK